MTFEARCARGTAILILFLAALCSADYITVELSSCESAPSQDLKLICKQLQSWDTQVRQHISVSTSYHSSVSTSYSSRSHSEQRYEQPSQWGQWSSWTSSSQYSPALSNSNVQIRARSRSMTSECSSGQQSSMCGEQRSQEPITYRLEVVPPSAPVSQPSGSYYVVQASGTLPHTSSLSGEARISVGPSAPLRSQYQASNAWQSGSGGTQHYAQTSSYGQGQMQQSYHQSSQQYQPAQSHYVPPPPPPQQPPNHQYVNLFASAQRQPARSAYECMDLICICIYIHGTVTHNQQCRTPNGDILQPAVRKEYRQMSTEERTKFHVAVSHMQRSGEFERIAQWHSGPNQCGGAHSGPAFLPWHREFLKRFEIALRIADHTVALPYWDSTLEGQLENGKDSCMFAPETNQPSSQASGGGFSVSVQQSYGRYRRQVGYYGRPLRERDVQAFERANSVSDVMAYTAPRPGCHHRPDWNSLEYSNGNVLLWIGGQAFQSANAAKDPMFYMHHAFLDNLWEIWRQTKQTPASRSSSYPPDSLNCSTPDHFAQSPMNPFSPLRNIDGLSNDYTSKLYRYQARPSCASGRDTECASSYLFCDRSHGQPHCAAKVRYGGNCSGFVKFESPCLSGQCINGVCS